MDIVCALFVCVQVKKNGKSTSELLKEDPLWDKGVTQYFFEQQQILLLAYLMQHSLGFVPYH